MRTTSRSCVAALAMATVATLGACQSGDSDAQDAGSVADGLAAAADAAGSDEVAEVFVEAGSDWGYATFVKDGEAVQFDFDGEELGTVDTQGRALATAGVDDLDLDALAGLAGSECASGEQATMLIGVVAPTGELFGNASCESDLSAGQILGEEEVPDLRDPLQPDDLDRVLLEAGTIVGESLTSLTFGTQYGPPAFIVVGGPVETQLDPACRPQYTRSLLVVDAEAAGLALAGMQCAADGGEAFPLGDLDGDTLRTALDAGLQLMGTTDAGLADATVHSRGGRIVIDLLGTDMGQQVTVDLQGRPVR